MSMLINTIRIILLHQHQSSSLLINTAYEFYNLHRRQKDYKLAVTQIKHILYVS